MKTKLLSTIRKYYEYKFLPTGEIVTRNKKNGTIKQYTSIEEYVRDISYTDTFIGYLVSHKWNKKKQIIKDERDRTRDENYWKSL